MIDRTIESERLILAPHGPEDWDDCAAMWGDAEVTHFIAPKPLTREESWSRLLRYAGHWSFFGWGYWAVREKASGRFVGDVGFADYRRELDPRLEAPEIGWVLDAWSHGRGFGTEAVGAALAWADARSDMKETTCIIAEGHERSVRVAERVGYRETGTALYHGRTMRVFRRTAAPLA